MPSLTPLHETYCKWDSTPPSQADVLEGLASCEHELKWCSRIGAISANRSVTDNTWFKLTKTKKFTETSTVTKILSIFL